VNKDNSPFSFPDSIVKLACSSVVCSGQITARVQKNEEVQGLLADFRARGGLVRPSTGFIFRERLKTHCSSVTSAFTEVDFCTDSVQPEDAVFDRASNALDPHNHQRMAVLFSSFSPKSHNAPHYCMHPWVVNMDFYGRNDIPLGGFLERYCFR
jgi:1-phosphatidylinositol-3-phosphate 5-kinase